MNRLISFITEQAYRHALAVIAGVVLLAAFGAWTITRINQELIPDIELPLLIVIGEQAGARPEEMADAVTSPVEVAARQLPGLRSTDSTSVAGLSVVILNFDYGSNLEQAEDTLGESLTNVQSEASLSYLTFDPSILPVVEMNLQGDLSQSELLNLAETSVSSELENLEGVAAVEVVGGALEEVVITLDRQSLLDTGLGYDEVAAALRANNVVLPSGELDTGEQSILVETVALYTSLEDIEQVQVATPDGSTIQLGEIAQVEQRQAASVGANRTSGEPSVGIRVVKEADANTVDVANDVKDRLAGIRSTLPDGASLTVFQDQSEFITESVNGVIIEGAIGGVLAVIVIFVFLLNWRTTIVTAVSIPLSLIAAVILLERLGYSLNIMTLAGLTIAIGRVIDDSIVVLENVYRHMTLGESTFRAVINGAREVAIAIVGATATTCAVFLPLGLIGGIIGELFISFSLAVVFALVASLVVAVTVIPVLARLTLAGRVRVEPNSRGAHTFVSPLYTPVLKLALANRWKTLGAAAVLFVASLGLVPLLPLVFFPDSGENIITVSIDARPGQAREAVLEQSIAVEDILAEFEVEEQNTVIAGASSGIGSIGNIISGNAADSATMTIELAGSVDKQDAADELRELIPERIPESENITVSATGGGFGPASGIEYTVSAESASAVGELAPVAEMVVAAVASVDGTANASSDLSRTRETIEVVVDSAAANDAGLTATEVASALDNLSAEQSITTVLIDSEALAVRLLVSSTDISSLESLGSLELSPGVALDDVADLQTATRQVSITRVDGRPAATVIADITDEDTGAVTASVQSTVDDIVAPEGVEVSVGGAAAELEEGFSGMLVAIVVSIILVYVIMALLFRSWLDPFVILFSLPLAVIGAIVALVVTGSPLSISAMIGLLMLVGIVVTNAIVLIEFVNMLRRERGYSTYDALIEGGQVRLRPILMTAVAAMLALVPLSLGLTEGALIASDLGRVVIGGLFSSTLLTLLVVPVVYSLVDDLKRRFRRQTPTTEADPTPATA
ncbi:MAG: hypothetical protein GEU28_13555 [Dehalococcoidia bacterium]|nr:hypothetical protein [Dehalococcoidia bacterium]